MDSKVRRSEKWDATLHTSPSNPVVFLEFAIAGQPVGRAYFELFADRVPRAAENFRQLCTGEYRPSGSPVGYKGNPVHRIMPGFLMQGGDLVAGDGSGAGGGIYGGGAPFPDDPNGLTATHSGGPGLLCSAAVERDANGSQWFVTLGEGGGGAGGLDGQHVVFGKVVGGMDVVRAVGAVRVTGAGLPTVQVSVSECGEM